MHEIAPDQCSLDALKETDLEKRAEIVIELARVLGCDQFVSRTEILQVNKEKQVEQKWTNQTQTLKTKTKNKNRNKNIKKKSERNQKQTKHKTKPKQKQTSIKK